jgi:hypothetical protein
MKTGPDIHSRTQAIEELATFYDRSGGELGRSALDCGAGSDGSGAAFLFQSRIGSVGSQTATLDGPIIPWRFYPLIAAVRTRSVLTRVARKREQPAIDRCLERGRHTASERPIHRESKRLSDTPRNMV